MTLCAVCNQEVTTFSLTPDYRAVGKCCRNSPEGKRLLKGEKK